MNWKQSFTLGLLAPGVWGGEVQEEWTILLDKTVTTESQTSGFGPNAQIIAPDFYPGEKIRLTVDGTIVFEGFARNSGHYTGEIGNRALWLTDGENTGEDFYVRVQPIGYYYYIFTREPGTYHIKVERIAPDGYSYNGVMLPRMPTVPHVSYKTYQQYPYATIVHHMLDPDKYVLMLTEYALKCDNNGVGPIHPDGSSNQFTIVGFDAIPEGADSWGYVSASHSLNAIVGHIEWTNYDVYDFDGNLRYPASEPVPVYE